MSSTGKNNSGLLVSFLLGAIFSFCVLLFGLVLFPGEILPFFGAVHAQAIFSPGAEGQVIEIIGSAQKSIELEVYVFTNPRVADALIEAHKRGVNVRVIMEERVDSESGKAIFERLKGAGVKTKWANQASFTLTHSKFMVIDGKKVLVGSMNFSGAALLTNREAGIILDGKAVEAYLRIFEEDWKIAI